MSDKLNLLFERDPNVVYREIAGEAILVPIRKNVADTACVYMLNETSARIWDLLDGSHTLADIRDALVAEYDVTAERAAADLLAVIDELQEIQLLASPAHAL